MEPYAALSQVAQSLIAELRWIDGEVARLDRTRDRLIHRRMVILASLSSQPAQPCVQPAAQQAAQQAAQPGTAAAAARPELSGKAVARLLLAAGVVLVVIAAAAFTVANWSSISPFGRSAVLLGVTAAVLAAPWSLTRRGLTATAESVAAIGLALMIADAYLVGRLAGAGPSPLAVAAGTATLATAWLCYGGAVRLRGPWLGAIAMAQLPLPFLAAGIAHADGIPLALALTASADLMLAYLTRRLAYHTESLTCLLAAGVTWSAGIGLAAVQAIQAQTVPAACWPAAALAAASLAGIALWPRVGRGAGPVAAISGFLLTGIALPVAVALPAGWPAVAFAVTGLGLSALAINRRKTDLADAGIRLDLVAAGSAATLGLTGLAVLPVALGELGGPGYGWPATIVLALVSLACWLAPVSQRTAARCAGLAVAALSFASVPAALGATGLPRLAILTAGAAGLACWAGLGRATQGTRGRALPGTAIVAAAVLGASAAAWSLGGYATAELAVLTVIFGIAATARNDITAVTSTVAALAAATGLAFAAATQAAFTAVAVATTAIAVATLLRKRRPVQALVLDLGAGPIVVLAAAASIGQADTFAVVTAAAAALASATSWLRSGLRQSVALAATGCAALAAVAAEWGPLTRPWSVANAPWHGHPLIDTGATAGLPFAVGVLAVGLAAVVTGAGALRGSSRGSLDAVAIALPVVAGPALVASRLGYLIAFGCLLVLAIGLTGWAAFGGSMAPAGGAAVATSLTLAWALAAITPTLIALCCLGTAYLVFAVLARGDGSRAVMAGLSAVAFEAAWCVGLAALGVTVVEAYTIPAAAIALAFGWRLSSASWPAFGPGLALLLLPSLIATWHGNGWIRPALLGIGAVAVTLIGARQRLQAPLVIGAVVAIADAGYQLAPAVRRLTELVPGWVPIAICGSVLLWTGATYEARLRNLASIRRAFAGLR